MIRTIGRWMLAATALILLSATVISMLPLNQWWSRMFDFPRIQIVVLAGLVLVLYALIFRFRSRRSWILGGTMVGVIVYQSIHIYPYTVLAKPQTVQEPVEDTTTLVSMLISNVLMTNHRSDDLLQLVRKKNPDLVLLMETNAWWQQQMEPLEKSYPYTVFRPLENTYGMHLYSRFPLHETTLQYLLKDSIPSVHTYFSLPSGQRVRLYCLHPEPPVPGQSNTSTKRDAELLLVGQLVQEREEPAIVTGDLNDVAWSPTSSLFRKTSRMLDPRIGRGFYNTFHAQYPLFRWPLDHVYHTEDFQLVNIEVLPDIGSDHFPVYFNLSFQPDEEWQQKKPRPANLEEKEEVEEKIEEGIEESIEDSKK